MRSQPRPRRQVPPWMLALAGPAFRYSTTRDAYVLRGVGQRHGPVLKRRSAERERVSVA